MTPRQPLWCTKASHPAAIPSAEVRSRPFSESAFGRPLDMLASASPLPFLPLTFACCCSPPPRHIGDPLERQKGSPGRIRTFSRSASSLLTANKALSTGPFVDPVDSPSPPPRLSPLGGGLRGPPRSRNPSFEPAFFVDSLPLCRIFRHGFLSLF